MSKIWKPLIDFDKSRSVDHVKNCPTAPDSRTGAIGAVEYDYKTANQDESYMHVTYADGRTVRMTNYEKFKKQREKRNVHVREERIIGGQPVDIKVCKSLFSTVCIILTPRLSGFKILNDVILIFS